MTVQRISYELLNEARTTYKELRRLKRRMEDNAFVWWTYDQEEAFELHIAELDDMCYQLVSIYGQAMLDAEVTENPPD